MGVTEDDDTAVRTHIVRQVHQLEGMLFYLKKMGFLNKVKISVMLDHMRIIVSIDSDIRKLALKHILQDFDFAYISGMDKVLSSVFDQMIDDFFSTTDFGVGV